MLQRLTEFLADAPLAKLFMAFKVLLVLRDAAGQPQGQYTVKESGDPHLYPGTFQKEKGYPEERQYIQVSQEEWSKWGILQDDPNKATVSMAELLDGWEGLDMGEIDDRSVISSATSQKCTELVLDTLGRPAMGRNPLVEFQLVDFE